MHWFRVYVVQAALVLSASIVVGCSLGTLAGSSVYRPPMAVAEAPDLRDMEGVAEVDFARLPLPAGTYEITRHAAELRWRWRVRDPGQADEWVDCGHLSNADVDGRRYEGSYVGYQLEGDSGYLDVEVILRASEQGALSMETGYHLSTPALPGWRFSPGEDAIVAVPNPVPDTSPLRICRARGVLELTLVNALQTWIEEDDAATVDFARRLAAVFPASGGPPRAGARTPGKSWE